MKNCNATVITIKNSKAYCSSVIPRTHSFRVKNPICSAFSFHAKHSITTFTAITKRCSTKTSSSAVAERPRDVRVTSIRKIPKLNF